ncbi:PUB12, partial [Symbiodinium sp. CCMP2456]
AEHPSKWMSEAVPLLVEAVAAGETMELREHAARALANLPMCEMSNAHCIVEAGGVPPLVHLLAVESYGCRAQAARAVGNLCVASQEAAKRAMRAGVVRPLLAALLTEDPALNGINLAVE